MPTSPYDDESKLRALGYVGDGGAEPLSFTYATLAAAQAVFPKALALSDCIDGCAIQRLGDLKAQAYGRVSIQLPAGTACINQPIDFGNYPVCLSGTGIESTKIQDTSVGGGLIVHSGADHFEIRELTFHNYFVNTASKAIAKSNGNGELSVTLLDVVFRNYAVCVSMQDVPRGVSVANVTCHGPDSVVPQPGGAFEISTSSSFRGSASFSFRDVLTSNYTWGWKFSLLAGLEGQVFNSCRSYNGWGMVDVECNVADPSYRALLWQFDACDWQGFGYAFNMYRCSDVTIRGGFWIANINPTSASPFPSDAETRYFSFRSCDDVYVEGCRFDVQANMGAHALVDVDVGCRNVTIRGSSVRDYSPNANAGFRLSGNDYYATREIDTYWNSWATGVNKVVDVFNCQLSQTQASAYGTVDFLGQYDLRGVTGAYTSDSNGDVTVPFPVRDQGGRFFITGAPTVLHNLQNGFGTAFPSNLKSVTQDNFSLRTTPNVTVQVVWRATGK